jgi:hypothetical protein
LEPDIQLSAPAMKFALIKGEDHLTESTALVIAALIAAAGSIGAAYIQAKARKH